MYRIDNATAVPTLPVQEAVGPNPNGFFSRGFPSLGTLATIVDDHWLNSIQQELCFVIEQAGITLDKTSYTQLYEAIQLLNIGVPYAISSSTPNAYTANLTPAPVSYGTGGLTFLLKFVHGNTGAATLNLNGIGTANLVGVDSQALAAGAIVDAMVGVISFDGTNFQLLNSNLKKDAYAVSASAANTYTATLTPPPYALITGMCFSVKFTNGNTAASTLNINGLGAKTIKKVGGVNLTSGDIASGMVGRFIYDGTDFQLLNPNASKLMTNVQVFDTSGNFTVPSGVSRIKVEGWSAGGGGSGGVPSLVSGSGGGAGGYSLNFFDVVEGAVHAITIGAAGVAGVISGGGGNGGATTFGALMSITGGTGGIPNGNGGIGGIGNGIINVQGGMGNSGTVETGFGGSAPLGGQGGNQTAGPIIPGGGGNGGSNNGVGGAGAKGRIIVTW